MSRNCFDDSSIYFGVGNTIMKYEIKLHNKEIINMASFDEKIQSFGVNKNILVVSLANNDTLYTDYDKNIKELLLFNNLSVLSFAFDNENNFIVILSIENGYEIIFFKTFQRKIIVKFEMTENFLILFNNVIMVHDKLLIILLEKVFDVYDKRSLKRIQKYEDSIDVTHEILNYVNVLKNGHFIIASTNKGKVFVFNFISGRLFIKFIFKEMISISCSQEKIFYIDKLNGLNFISLSLISNDEDDSYYDEKMVYILDSFEKQREKETQIAIENNIKEKNIQHFNKFIRKNDKFILKQ